MTLIYLLPNFVFCFKKHNQGNQINDEYENTSQEKKTNLKVVTSDTQVIECKNTNQENNMTNLEVIISSSSSDAHVTGT